MTSYANASPDLRFRARRRGRNPPAQHVTAVADRRQYAADEERPSGFDPDALALGRESSASHANEADFDSDSARERSF